MKSIESIDKTAKSIGAFDSINYGVYYVVGKLLKLKYIVTNSTKCL